MRLPSMASRRAGPDTMPGEPCTSNTRQCVLDHTSVSPGTPASSSAGLGGRRVVERRVGEGHVPHPTRDQPCPVGGGFEPAPAVEQRVIAAVDLPLPPAGERHDGRDVIGLPVQLRGHHLDPGRGVVVAGEEAEQRCVVGAVRGRLSPVGTAEGAPERRPLPDRHRDREHDEHEPSPRPQHTRTERDRNALAEPAHVSTHRGLGHEAGDGGHDVEGGADAEGPHRAGPRGTSPPRR